MSHIPVNHHLRPLYRTLAGFAAVYLLVFGVVGVAQTSGAGLFARDNVSALGLRTNLAFSVASVIAAHYDSPWVDATAYGVASLVAVARVRLNAHWASDVLGGAVVGGFIGHHLVDFNRRWRAQNESAWMPELGTDGQQLLLTWRF